MTVEIWFVYIGTVLIVMSTPGPSQLLMLSNSINSGFHRSLFTAAGDLTANFIQMVIASAGLVGIISNSRDFFSVVKWAGVAYLAYLGLRLMLFKTGKERLQQNRKISIRCLYWQGFVTSAANPKALVFFAALFPQFINSEGELLWQFVNLSSTYLIIDATFLCFYGKFAEWVSIKLVPSARQHLNKMSGAFLIIAAILLGLKDIESKP